MRRKLIVTTCGTSLLTNNSDPATRRELRAHANDLAQVIDGKVFNRLEAHVAKQAERLLAMRKLSQVRDAAAELNGIIGIYGDDLKFESNGDQHLLLHTDTWLGEQSASNLGLWLNQNGLSAQLHKIDDLNTAELDSFRSGMNSLVSWCEQTLPEYARQQYQIIFNLTGGFKSLQGFMQTLGMFYADELIYIFEGSDELLRIPRLPIEFETAAKQAIKDSLLLFRLLDHPGATLPAATTQSIPETFLYQVGDEVELSVWGRLIWQCHKVTIYQEQVLEPIGGKVEIEISERAMKQARGLSVELRQQFNQRLDDLYRHFELAEDNSLNRLDFKKLKGAPCPPSTHECDLWSNQGAWRAFGHFRQDGRYVIDEFGPCLH